MASIEDAPIHRRKAFGAQAVLCGILGSAGVAHFVIPGVFDEIVPRMLPGSARTWTYASGVAELGLSAALLIPRWRRPAARLAAALFVAVFPANLQMAIDWSDRPLPQRMIAYGRLPLQIPLIWLALTVAARLESAPDRRAAEAAWRQSV